MTNGYPCLDLLPGGSLEHAISAVVADAGKTPNQSLVILANRSSFVARGRIFLGSEIHGVADDEAQFHLSPHSPRMGAGSRSGRISRHVTDIRKRYGVGAHLGPFLAQPLGWEGVA